MSAATVRHSAATAYGTVLMAQTRRTAPAAHLDTIPVGLPALLVPQPATCLPTAATTRPSVLMEQMRDVAGTASLATSDAGMRSVCMRRGFVTGSQTVLMAVMSGTAPMPCPARSSQPQSLAALCVACCSSLLWAAPASSMPSVPKSTGQWECSWLERSGDCGGDKACAHVGDRFW